MSQPYPAYYRENRERDESVQAQVRLLNGLRRVQGQLLLRSGICVSVFQDMAPAVRREFREGLPYVIRTATTDGEGRVAGRALSIEYRHETDLGYFAVAHLVALQPQGADSLIPVTEFDGLDYGILPKMADALDQLRLDNTIPTLDPHYFDIQ